MRKIQAFEAHIKRHTLLYKLAQIRQNLYFSLSIERVRNDTEFLQRWPNFVNDLNESTEETLLCIGLAMHQRIVTDLPPLTSSQLTGIQSSSRFSLLTIRPRLVGHSPVVDLQSLKQYNYGRLISVRGTVIRVNAPELVLSWMAFRCSQCNCEQAVRQTDRNNVQAPTSCKTNGCRARSNFRPLIDSPFSRTETFQMIRLQESMQSAQSEATGRIPKSIDVELAFDLVDTVSPGDDITLTGIIKVRAQQNESTSYNRSRKEQASLHQFYIHGVSTVSNKNVLSTRNSEFTERDMQLFQELKNDNDPFYLFVHSLCSRVFGHEMVKAGLLLALFGGSGNGEKGDRTPGVGRRVESHVLIVGDPGIGKSLLLQACANVSPRGIIVCGKSASNAGLTVSVRHEKGSGNAMEAGALVLTDQGVCCIDEFDKMKSNYQVCLTLVDDIIFTVIFHLVFFLVIASSDGTAIG